MITTQNESWGFYNEARNSALRSITGDPDSYGTDAQRVQAEKLAAKAFDRVARELVSAGTVQTKDVARDFLDSRMGRHLGDQIGHTGLAASVKWLGHAVRDWKIAA